MTAAIDVVDLHKEFSLGFGVRKRVGLDRMTFSVAPGEVFGFLGPNGAGKTTSIKVLTSLLRQDRGTASIFGKPPGEPATRRRIGYLPESPVFYDHLTGREFLHFCGTLCDLRGKALKDRTDQLLALVGMTHAANLQIRRYSKGMTQRVGIAQALLHDPELVILDEPMSGLDPMGRADVRDIIVSLKKQGKTIFFSTHIIPDVEVICTKVGVCASGNMLRIGTVAELLAESAGAKTEVLCEGLPAGFTPVGGPSEVVSSAGRRLFLVDRSAEVKDFVQQVYGAGGTLVSLNQQRGSLEDHVVRILAAGGKREEKAP